MAIFSLNHSFVGRSTHPAGSASVFARYITRADAATEVIGARMPTDRSSMMQWLDDQEGSDRKNARVIDKVIVALPLELDHEQNKELLQAYGERMTEGRASWAAAIHDGAGDLDNPHAHIIFRDRDIETGKRVMLTTEKGSTQRFRDGWEQEANIALERAGREERIDKRSLADQGIDREAQIHVGPGAEHLADRDYQFSSNAKEVTRIINGQPTIVTVNYPVIDEGKTRFEENEARKQRNREREFADGYMGPVNLPTGNRTEPPSTRTYDERDARLEALIRDAEKVANLYSAFANLGTLPGDESDPLAAIVADHLREREPFKKKETEIEKGGADPWPREAKKDAADAIGGAGLKIIGRITDSIESLFDGKPTRRRGDEEHDMADDKKLPQRTVEQQQRATEAELAASRKSELEAFLQQRDRERHIDRGR